MSRLDEYMQRNGIQSNRKQTMEELAQKNEELKEQLSDLADLVNVLAEVTLDD